MKTYINYTYQIDLLRFTRMQNSNINKDNRLEKHNKWLTTSCPLRILQSGRINLAAAADVGS